MNIITTKLLPKILLFPQDIIPKVEFLGRQKAMDILKVLDMCCHCIYSDS